MIGWLRRRVARLFALDVVNAVDPPPLERPDGVTDEQWEKMQQQSAEGYSYRGSYTSSAGEKLVVMASEPRKEP